MRASLRWKILLLAVLTPLVLGLAVLVTVNRNVRRHVDSSSIHESLEHSVSVFESMLTTRSRALAGGARVVVQDPRFFSLLMLDGAQRDSRFKATVRGMASDFSHITETDLFEVFDRQGRLLASVGRDATSLASRTPLVNEALARRPAEGVLVENGAQFQAAATPVFADGRLVGVLLLGARVDEALANQLKSQMLCEVTFVTGTDVTGTTLRTPREIAALKAKVEGLRRLSVTDLAALGVLRVDAGPTVYLTMVRRIPGSDPAQSQLYVMQRSFDPETSFLHVMQSDMLRLALLALVAALVTGWWFSDQILRPLHALVRGARAMERGDYTQPLEVLHRDEIGYLVERFVAMRQREHAYVDNLEHVTRLKSDFISVASYELRTPISGLASFRDLFADGTFGPVSPRQAEALDAMRQFITRLVCVADDATLVAQVQGERLKLDIAACDVEPMARLAVAVASAQGTGRATVPVHCEGLDEPLEVDEKALSQAITHLVRTALHFAPEAGEVAVRVDADGEQLRIEVGNLGSGIPEARLDALLRRGEATAAPAPEAVNASYDFKAAGLGLGVAIARSVAQAHGGELSAVRAEIGGSAFVLELPAQPAEAGRAAA